MVSPPIVFKTIGKAGFTLIEMSIVLVIIGLIIGGVLVGRDLISAASVRAQISQIEKYNVAVNTFRVKYGYLPGDIPDPAASQYGFAARGSFAAQGDGNGLLEGLAVNAANANSGVTVFGGEVEMFWVDLSQAHLIDGSFSQINILSSPGPNVESAQVGQFMPEAKIGQGNYIYVWSGGWQELFLGNSPGDSINYFSLSANIGNSGDPWSYSNITMTVQQAYNIDTKLDDGLPQSGRVLAMYPSGVRHWAAGGNPDPNSGEGNGGDYDEDTGGPITAQTVNPFYADQNGVALNDTCYNNGDTLKAEHYSMAYNSGAGRNCALSFRFQ